MKILIIQQKMIGDVLTSSILFQAIKDKHPDAELHYLINTHTFSVVENNPFIDRFIFFTKEVESSKKALLKLAKSIRKEKFDVVIDVYSKLSSNIITLFSGAKIRISKYKPYTFFIYNHTIKYATKAKTNASLAIENRLELLAPLGIENIIIKPKIYLTSREIDVSKTFLEQHQIDFSKPIFMISVLGSGTNKTYPLLYMAQLINNIVEQTEGQILFNYIPKQVNQAKTVYNLCKEDTQKHIYFDVFGKNLRMFLAITKHCTALIGNEGGAVNMAKALGIATFTIFSPWISKDSWSLFEDEKKHISVHLKDYKQELYNYKEEKDMKRKAIKLYEIFKPEFFKDKLRTFLN